MHDLTLAGLYSDRLALLHEGTVVASGPAAEVLRAETLAEFYGVRVTVHHEPDGTVVVVPARGRHHLNPEPSAAVPVAALAQQSGLVHRP